MNTRGKKKILPYLFFLVDLSLGKGHVLLRFQVELLERKQERDNNEGGGEMVQETSEWFPRYQRGCKH